MHRCLVLCSQVCKGLFPLNEITQMIALQHKPSMLAHLVPSQFLFNLQPFPSLTPPLPVGTHSPRMAIQPLVGNFGTSSTIISNLLLMTKMVRIMYTHPAQQSQKHRLQISSILHQMNGQKNTTATQELGTIKNWSSMTFSKWMPKGRLTILMTSHKIF